jgi:hypothetical protein
MLRQGAAARRGSGGGAGAGLVSPAGLRAEGDGTGDSTLSCAARIQGDSGVAPRICVLHPAVSLHYR